MSTDTYDAARARIAELRALVEAGTPGPWDADERTDCAGLFDVWGYLIDSQPNPVVFKAAGEDAHLIATAVNLLPAALDMAEGVLGRHRPDAESDRYCADSCDVLGDGWPCPDAAAALRFLGIEDGA